MMGISSKTVYVENAHIVSLFLFQYSLTMFLTVFYNPTVVIFTSTIALMCISILINGLRVKYSKSILLFLAIMILLVFKCMWGDGNSLYPVFMFIEIAFPVFLIMANGFNYDRFVHFSYKLAYLNFFAIVLFPFTVPNFPYMRFGYGMLLTVIFLYVKISTANKWNFLDILFFIISFFMMLFYGARGALFSFFVMVIIDRFLIKKKMVVRNTIALITSGIIIYKFDKILDIFQRISSAIGVRTYALIKFRMQLDSGIETASSGRSKLYRNVIEKIQNDWVFGTPMWSRGDETMYAHNLFLQAGLDFGVLGILTMVLFVIYVLYQIWNTSKMQNQCQNQCYVLAILFSIAIGRLMFSSIYWRRPEFWMLLITFLIIATNKTVWHKNTYKKLLGKDVT